MENGATLFYEFLVSVHYQFFTTQKMFMKL